jgi:sporulation protein YlmC with PRC-barrel domain
MEVDDKEKVMTNLRSWRDLSGYSVRALDGDVGRVRELYFDDAQWQVRHVVVDVGRWSRSRRVLVSPSAIAEILWEHRRLVLTATRDQVWAWPEASADQPVARQLESRRRSQANWAVTVAGDALTSYSEALRTPTFEPLNANGTPFDPHLRTSRVVVGLDLRAEGASVGRIADLVLDDASWEVLYLVVAWHDGKRFALPTNCVRRIAPEEKAVTAGVDSTALASSPRLEPATLFTRQYEQAVRQHFARVSLHP